MADEQRALDSFRAHVLEQGRLLYRDLPWRRTRDAYAIWISEVMLQQTQVSRVDGRWQHWLERFPSVDALAGAAPADVLDEWQGMGYNRRALALLQAARQVADVGGELPREADELEALPGIGPATAAGIRAFAYNLPGVYLETNVRAVLLHELYPDADQVPDRELAAVVRATCPADDRDPADDPRTWYYALLDYGAHLKRILPNPSRRARAHVRQTSFEGSHRQKRAAVVRILLAAQPAGGIDVAEVAVRLSDQEQAAGRPPVSASAAQALLTELAAEGFCHEEDGRWLV